MSFLKSIFGTPASGSAGAGSNAAGPASSAAAPASASNPFGQPPQQQQPSFSFGGQQSASSSSSSYPGQQQPQQQQFAFGAPPQMPFMFPAAAAAAAPGPAARWEIVGDDQPAMSPSSNPFDDAASAVAGSAAPSARTYFSMVIHGGRLYTFGGFGDTKGRYNDLRSYDLERGRWELVANTTGEAPKPIYLHSAVVSEGSMYVFGGSVGKDSNELYAYEFASRVWRRIVPPNPQAAANVPSPRYGHAAVVHGGHMLVVGGCRMNNVYFSDSYLYEFRTNLWRKIADIPVDIAYHSLVAHEGRVLLTGGYNGVRFNGHFAARGLAPSISRSQTAVLVLCLRCMRAHRTITLVWLLVCVCAAQIFQYDMSGLHAGPGWNPLMVTAKASSPLSSAGTRQPPASCGSAVVLGADSLFHFAGYTASGHAADLYKLDLRTNEWTVIDTPGARPVSRAYLQSAFNPTDGCLYILGGYDGSKCVSDFRRIQVLPPDVNLFHMLSTLDAAQIAQIAVKHFGTRAAAAGPYANAKGSMDEMQLQNMFANLKAHQRAAIAAAPAAAASSGSSSLSPASSVWFPFDTSRLSDLMELGFPRQTCLDCLADMHAKKQDTKNFSRVVEALLSFTPTTPAAASSSSSSVAASSSSAAAQPAPAASPSSASESPLTARTASMSNAAPVMPPSSNSSSLQDQVSRLSEENKELKCCKVCMEETIDCLLQPCAHLVVCSGCAEDLKKRGLECPAARCTIKSYLKVYWS